MKLAQALINNTPVDKLVRDILGVKGNRVVMSEYTDRIRAVKTIREVYNLGLKEAVETANLSTQSDGIVIEENVSKERFEFLKARFNKAGVTVNLI